MLAAVIADMAEHLDGKYSAGLGLRVNSTPPEGTLKRVYLYAYMTYATNLT